MLPDKKQDELEKKFLENDCVFLVSQTGKHVKLAAKNPGTRVGGIFTLEYVSEPLAKDFADKFRSRKSKTSNEIIVDWLRSKDAVKLVEAEYDDEHCLTEVALERTFNIVAAKLLGLPQVAEFDRKKLDALVEKLRKDQGITDEAKPFFSFGRDVSHKNEPCYFCGFMGNIHGEGRYIHSPLSELAQDDGSITEAQVMAAAILFCGKCEGIIDKLGVLEMDFD